MSLLVQIITPFCLIKLSSYHWIVSCIYYCLLLYQYKTLKLNKFNETYTLERVKIKMKLTIFV